MAIELARTKFGRVVLSDTGTKLLGEAVIRALAKRAQAGLGVGASGFEVTLHGYPHTRKIWETAEATTSATLRFPSPIAFLLETYKALAPLDGAALDEAKRELGAILEAHLEVVE